MIDIDSWEAERRERLLSLAKFRPIETAIHNPSGTLQIVLAAPEDAGHVFSVMRSAFEEHRGVLEPPSGADNETVEEVATAIAEGGALLGYYEGHPIGTGRFRLMPDHLYVGRVGVAPDYRGRGVASALMVGMEYIARSLGCEEIRLGTRTRLPQNLALYKKLGYEIVDIRVHARGPDQIALLVKRLAADTEAENGTFDGSIDSQTSASA